MSNGVLITGASGAIGQATALLLAEKGYRLALHYHQNQEAVESLRRRIEEEWGREVILYRSDLSRSEGIKHLVQQFIWYPDIFIYTAGIAQYGLMSEVTEEEYESTLHLNLTAPFKLTQAILPALLRKRWGRIIYVTSIWGEIGGAGEALYSMTKGGLNALTKALAKEVAPNHITVNAVSPGAIDTPMLSRFSAEEKLGLMDEIPSSRLGQADEVAHAIHFLLQEKSGYITGEVLRINGGWLT